MIALSLAASAQRVDLDRFNFTVSYRSFPEEPLPATYKTYNVRIESSPSLGIGFAAGSFENQVLVEGLKKVPGTGHVTVLLMLDDLIVEKTETTERVETRKDKQNVETKKSFFATEMQYSFSARVSVYDYKGATVLSNQVLYDRENKGRYKSAEAASAAEASNNFNNQLSDIRTNLASQLTGRVISTLNSVLNNRFGYAVQRVNDVFWVLNNKRHPEYTEAQKAWNGFRNAIVMMTPDEPVDKVREKLKPVIAYYDKIKTTYSGSDKEARKLRYSSYYNLAKIYLYLDDPAAAQREADALSMNDWDEADGRSLRALAESLDEQLRRNNASSRHFPVDIARYEPPVR